MDSVGVIIENSEMFQLIRRDVSESVISCCCNCGAIVCEADTVADIMFQVMQEYQIDELADDVYVEALYILVILSTPQSEFQNYYEYFDSVIWRENDDVRKIEYSQICLLPNKECNCFNRERKASITLFS